MTTQISEALDKARRRGMQECISEWKKEGHLTIDEFALRLNTDDRTVAWMNRTGYIYSISHPETGKLKYPGWQIIVPSDRLVGALRPFYKERISQWIVHFFMIAENDELCGLTPIEYIEDKTLPMDVLIRVVRDKAGPLE